MNIGSGGSNPIEKYYVILDHRHLESGKNKEQHETANWKVSLCIYKVGPHSYTLVFKPQAQWP